MLQAKKRFYRRVTGASKWAALLLFEVLAKSQALLLIVGANVDSVNLVGTGEQAHISKPANDLAIFQQEGDAVSANFQNCASALYVVAAVAETGIEEASIVHAELAHGRIEGHHLSGIVRGDAHLFARGENVEVPWFQHQAVAAGLADGVPEILWRIVIHVGQVNCRSILSGFVGDYFRGVGGAKVDGNAQAIVHHGFNWSVFLAVVDQRLFFIEHGDGAIAKLRVAAQEAYLVQLHARTENDGKGAGNDLRVKFALVAGGCPLEFNTVVGDKAGEDIEPAG